MAERSEPAERRAPPPGALLPPGPGLPVLPLLSSALLLLLLLLGVSCRPVPEPETLPPVPGPPASPPSAVEPAEPLTPLPAPTVPPPPVQRQVPLTVRVGLYTDLGEVRFDCCAVDLQASAGDAVVAVHHPLVVEPDAGTTRPGVFRLQVAALHDGEQAAALATRLQRDSGLPAEALLDAESGLFRVRVGRFATRAEAERARRPLATLGVADSWVVAEGGGVGDPALVLRQGRERRRIPGRWLSVVAIDGSPVPLGDRRFRGRVLVYLNDRGTLNVIDETLLEDYLRGVVPREMGPDAYPQLEALKAQAVAARTYALRNLGEFDQEGYDICATPRCQVFGGVGAEHPLSDRAVEETAGQVLLWHGEPIDALYSSTCGGHTEDVGTVFPLKRGLPYLKGVPCVEQGTSTIDGGAPGAPFPAAVTHRLLPGGSDAAALGARLTSLAALGGLPTDAVGSLDSVDAAAVRRYVSRLLDLSLDSRLFVAGPDLAYLLESPPADWSEQDRRLAALFVKLGLQRGDARVLSSQEQEMLLLRLAEYLHLVQRETASFLSVTQDRRLEVKEEEEGSRRTLALPADLATYRRLAGETQPGALSLLPGDRLELLWSGKRLLALVQEVDPQGVAFDRTSKWSSWQRFRSDAQLSAMVAERFPGFRLRTFQVLERGVSGRVGKIRLIGQDGTSELVEGLAVRWTLDLPDTLFTARHLDPPGGEPGWLFNGRGLGHGVGLCQVGSYGMAMRGHDYREILLHYYTGVQLGRIVGREISEQ